MAADQNFETDRIPTDKGDLLITFIGHGTLLFQWGELVIHVDPWSRLADYTHLPKADVILLTHAHKDHLDPQALDAVTTPATEVIMAPSCAKKLSEGVVLTNGDVRVAADIRIEAVAAYNQVHLRDDGQPFHPPGRGNGYVLTFGRTRVYVAGDTENISEMKALEDIAVAFLPMNLPYTMTPEMVADAARAFRPQILYPYHFGNTPTERLCELLADETGVEVRIRRMA